MAVALEGTRLKILNILRSQGSVTVEDLAKDIGLASSTIRRHLDILQRDQLVAFDQVRRKLGRPEFAYRLTEHGHGFGQRGTDTVLARASYLADSVQLSGNLRRRISGMELATCESVYGGRL